MRKFRIVVLSRKFIFTVISAVLIVIVASISVFYAGLPANNFTDPKSGIIVIDPGHGGVDGGANKDGILEKEVNLAIAKKLKGILEHKEYKIVMTREKDVSLDSLCEFDTSRHQKDLHARTDIINSCNAQLFISIHVNCNFNRPATDGSIVIYRDTFLQNKELAYCIQRTLNKIVVNGRKRTIHDPMQGDFYILKYSQVPGVIVETAFLSNEEEKRLLQTDSFQEQLAEAIAEGVDKYLAESGQKQVGRHDGR